MARFYRTLVFRHTLLFVGLFIVFESVVFGVLYWSTIAVYERRLNATIESEAIAMLGALESLNVAQMADAVNRVAHDEPGEHDEYMLATSDRRYLAGNISRWPDGVVEQTGLIDLALGDAKTHELELHRIRVLRLDSGHYLLVGRNLTELQKIRDLIGKALLRTVLLTVLFGFGGGYVFSRQISGRLERVNRSSRAILDGDISRRMPVSGDGDEFDDLSENLNRMLDRIEGLMEGMRSVSDNIAHDLRKPISRLRSRIELTLMGPREPTAYRDALVTTIEELDDILNVFNALLTIAIAESGASRDFERTDLAEVARSTVELYEPVAEDVGLNLKADIGDSLDTIVNPHLVTQALANLVDNAIKYAGGNGEVTVSARRDGEWARLRVTDSGPGIPESFRSKALDRFSRLEQSRTTPGSGLGLSLVRAVARLHGGSIELEDNRPGLRATLSIPLHETRPRSRSIVRG